METSVAFPSPKKETLAGFPLWHSYPCPGCLCRLLWSSGCGVRSCVTRAHAREETVAYFCAMAYSQLWVLGFLIWRHGCFPRVTEQLASPTPEHQSVARDHCALSMPASQERSWIWVRGSPKVRIRYWLVVLLCASCWLETSLPLGSLGPVLGGTCYLLIYGSNRNPQPQLQEHQTAIMCLIHARY